MKHFVFAALVGLVPSLLQAESVLTDSVDNLTNKRVVQLDIYSNETKNVVLVFCLNVDEGGESVHFVNKSFGHVFFPDDYKSETKRISYRSSLMSQPNLSTWSAGLHQLRCDSVYSDGRWRSLDFAAVCRMLAGDELVLSITEDEKRYTFDLTTDSVRGMRDILIARGEHLVRLEALEEKTQAEYRDNASRIDEIKHAGYEAGMKKVHRASKGYSHSYARRIAPNFAKKAGFKGEDAEYFVSGFMEAMTN